MVALFFTERPVTRCDRFLFYFYIHISKNNVCIKVRVPRHTAAAVHWYIPGHDGLKKHFSRLHSALHCTTYRMQPTTLLVLPLKLGLRTQSSSPLSASGACSSLRSSSCSSIDAHDAQRPTTRCYCFNQDKYVALGRACQKTDGSREYKK